ncbi:MAG: rhamnose:proton symporter [Verrucomicrobiaceae bacterium]|nr:MAG: rhamnose:proton symporter [Verrucomicrobiaceae bacterium]
MSFPIHGILLHAIGAFAAAICFTPQHKIRNWTYETFWFWMSVSSWFLLPVLGSLLFIPHLWEVLADSPREAMWMSFGYGAAYGFGGMAFGFAIRYVGYSLTYALAVGLSAVLGFFLTPLIQGKLGGITSSAGGNAVLTGVAVGFAGIILCGLAGRRKEREVRKSGSGHGPAFRPALGIPLCVLAGVLSAVYSLALGSADPVAEEALKKGANPELVMNVRFLFASTGAFLSTLPITLWQLAKKGGLRELAGAGIGGKPAPRSNILWGCLAGLLWYLQFIFYGMGHNRMDTLGVASWPLHMIMLILFSTLVAIVRREWSDCSPATKRFVTVAISILILAVLVIGYGNHLNQAPIPH